MAPAGMVLIPVTWMSLLEPAASVSPELFAPLHWLTGGESSVEGLPALVSQIRTGSERAV